MYVRANSFLARNLGVPLYHVKNKTILRSLFRNFVTNYFQEMETLHSNVLDALAESIRTSKAASQTQNVSVLFILLQTGSAEYPEQLYDLRVLFEHERKWSPRTLSLVSEKECHSDHEEHDGAIFRLVPEKRNKKVTHYIRKLDKDILHCTFHLQGTHAYQQLINIQQTGKKSHTFPSPDMALDWWDPREFNKLPAAIRKLYANSPIALPLEERMEDPDWKDMKTGEFMARYGYAVKALYDIPGKGGAISNWLEDAMMDSPSDVDMEAGISSNSDSTSTPVNSDLDEGEGDDEMDEEDYRESNEDEDEDEV